MFVYNSYIICMNVIYDISDKIRLSDSYSKHKPIIITVNEFTETSMKEFCASMNEAQNTHQDVIPVHIDSYGGNVYSLLGMVDAINSSSKPVATICIGKAMSCGALLLACGHENLRFATENSTIMIHDISKSTFGKIEEIKSSACQADLLQKKIMKLLDDSCGKKEGYFQGLIHDKHHADWFLSPEECLEHGIIDKIGVPTFKVKVTCDITFYSPK